VNRDFNVLDRVVTPYFQAECFYDTRCDGWARELYPVGAEIAVTRHFRVEPSVARQVVESAANRGEGGRRGVWGRP
jgi:hypothetical protein